MCVCVCGMGWGDGVSGHYFIKKYFHAFHQKKKKKKKKKMDRFTKI